MTCLAGIFRRSFSCLVPFVVCPSPYLAVALSERMKAVCTLPLHRTASLERAGDDADVGGHRRIRKAGRPALTFDERR